MRGQMDIFSFIPCPVEPGDWLTMESGHIGDQIDFEEIVRSVGKMIVLDKSTQSMTAYKAVLVEKIYTYDDGSGRRRLIYFDGCRQRGLVDEMYFDPHRSRPNKAYRFLE